MAHRPAPHLVGALLGTLFLVPGCGDDDGASGMDAAVDAAVDAGPTFAHPARVLRILDGDTLEVDFLGATRKVRFAQVNCPEISAPAEPYAEEAKQFTVQHALPQSTIGLEFDNEACGSLPLPAGCSDIYDRLLAYVRTVQWEDLNALLVQNGLARVYEDASFLRKTYYLELQTQAQASHLGIWSE
jgi:micrococcal nuclease